MVDPAFNLYVGWLVMLGGILSATGFEVCLHRNGFLEGDDSFRRRFVFLGHICLFGLGFLNMLFSVTLGRIPISEPAAILASLSFILGTATMPLCCYLAAWRMNAWNLIPIPIVIVAVGIIAVLHG
jgi:hypothetical protein